MSQPRLNHSPRTVFRRYGLLLALVVLVATVGCGTYPQSIFELKADYARRLQDLFFYFIVLPAAVVFVVVQGVLLYTVLRFKAKPSDVLPKQFTHNTKLEIAWTAAPAIVLAFVLVPTIDTIFVTQAPAPEGSMLVKVLGKQFWWEYEYPEYGIVTANEVYLPVGRTVNFQERSADVIHSFWIPALGGKRDVLPNRDNYYWLTPEVAGEYPGQCAELCGDSHANMRTRAFVLPPEEFMAWVQRQSAPAAVPAEGTPAAQGAQLFTQRGCAGCHQVRGTAAAGRVGPDLTHFGSRKTLAAAMFPNDEPSLRAWLKNPPGVKPGATMPNLGLSNEDVTALVAYLQSLQ